MEKLSMDIVLDIVDEEWMRDTLPNDDIPFPPGVAPVIDDTEEVTNQEQPLVSQDKWNELGLHTIQ
ncbi:hypothetical protein KP509_17G045900 [Ceratopteris richardii]|uniref:Anaphase-promoting complex subunit 13 n=1 Tax=Ceratopteris richardii TaxID=49495 RepID=A0A8T2SZ04_CERRI|nr:hypothetical protein KP509_17G045900 [Ceratopteris richardii]